MFVWFLGRPGDAFAWLGWRAKLWLVGWRDRVKDRERSLTMYYQWYGWRWRWLRDIVDRISPFDINDGYRNRRLRSVIWKVSHPVITQKLASLRWVLRVTGWLPYIGPGKYEQMDPQTRLKVEWLDARYEDATETTGEVDFGEHIWAFVDYEVPWSREPENWTLSVNHMGFVGAAVYTDADELWREFEITRNRYEQWLNANDPSHVHGDGEDVGDWRSEIVKPW